MFIHILIGEYGEVVINEPIHTHYRYGILIPKFGRYEYTKANDDEYKRSDQKEVTILK